jgi:hypothetical protein
MPWTIGKSAFCLLHSSSCLAYDVELLLPVREREPKDIRFQTSQYGAAQRPQSVTKTSTLRHSHLTRRRNAAGCIFRIEAKEGGATDYRHVEYMAPTVSLKDFSRLDCARALLQEFVRHQRITFQT